jgi:hypothetical protein
MKVTLIRMASAKWLLVDQDNPHLQSLSHAWEREAPSFLAQGEGLRVGGTATDYLYTGHTCPPEGRRDGVAGSARDAAKPRLGWIIM